MKKQVTQNFQLVCGMEIHAEPKTKSKMFCGCKNDPFYAEQPNIHTCPVCLGMPGGLPVANQRAIEWTIQLGLALNCQVNLFSKFDRKHYFYPDLPKGYQISQYDIPFCVGGYLDTTEGRVRITRIHLEEDTGKLLHKTVKGKKVSLIDYNRSGVPLVEIVSEPDIKTAHQAAEYSRKLRNIIRYLEISECDMEQGGMRLEANISVTPDFNHLPNYKVELKNINSFKFMEQAIEFEVSRQSKLLAQGKTPIQETRGYNPKIGETFSQRSKEEAADYRYFPDPDIPPIRFSPTEIERLQAALPEMPEQVMSRWEKSFQIQPRFSEPLLTSASQTSWLEKIWRVASDQQLDPNEIAKQMSQKKIELDQKISPKDIVNNFQSARRNHQLSDDEAMKTIKSTLGEHQAEHARFQAGEKQLLGFFLGKIREKVGPDTDMKQMAQLLTKHLAN